MKQIRASWRLVFLVLVGSLSWSLTMVKSGWPTKWGLGFWGANGHDGIWHLALIESIKNGFPINNPLFSGAVLTDYHWGFDLVMAGVSRLTGISASLLYFQIIPPLMALAIGVLSYLLIKEWTSSRAAARWATFFTYFGGSFGWVVTFWWMREFGGESLFWAQQSISSLINPPFALSLILLITGLYIVLRFPRPGWGGLVLQAAIFGTLFMVKSYAGVVGLVGLVMIGLWQSIFEREFSGLVRAVGAIVLTAVLVMWSVPGVNRFLIFDPFWFPRTMIEARDRFFLPKIAEALEAYLSLKMYGRVILIEVAATTVFVLGNLGTRALALGYLGRIVKRGRKVVGFDVVIAAMFAISVFFPLVFVQRGTAWNTIQFFYYGEIFAGWVAGIVMANVKWKSFSGRLATLVVVLLTVPTTLSSLYYQYVPPRPPAVLAAGDVVALSFLGNLPKGTVLVYPYNRSTIREGLEPPVPLRLYDTTAYVSAYSGQPSYLADTVNLDILGVVWKGRYDQLNAFFFGKSPFLAMRFLRDNHISYIYLSGDQRLPASEQELGLTKVYARGEVEIYKVQGI